MKLKTPLKTVHHNLMLTKSGDVWAYYQITPEVIPSSNTAKIEENKTRMKMLFEELERYKDFHLEMYPRQIELEKRFSMMEQDFHDSTKDIGHYYNNETIHLLQQELGLITENCFVLGVRIKGDLLEGSDDMKDVVKNTFMSITDTMVHWLGLDRDMSSEFFERFESAEKEIYSNILSVGGTRLTEDHLIYINRYNFLRDIHHEIENEKVKRGVSSITDSIIDPTEPGYLRLQTTEGETYMSYVVVNNFPNNMEYTHLFQHAQNMPFPVEVHIKGKYQDKDSVDRKIQFTKQRLRETDKDRANAGEDYDDQEESYKDMLNYLQTSLKDNPVFMNWVATFVVYGKDKEECKANAN